MRWKKLEPIIQSEVSQKEKHQYSILTHILEKAMATHSSTLAWKIPWMEKPGRLQSMGSLRVGALVYCIGVFLSGLLHSV